MALTRTFLGINQDTSGTPAASIAVTVNSTGYEFVVVAVSFEGSPTTVTVTDNKGHSYTNHPRMDNTFNNDISAQMSYGSGGTAGASHTITATFGASRPYCEIDVWGVHSDNASTIAADAHTEAQGDAFSTPDAGSLVNAATAVSFCHGHGYAVQTGTPGTGWTEDSEANNNYAQSRGPDAAGTYDPSWTWTGNQAWCAVAASFKESAGGGGSTPPPRLALLGVGI
jgi:hypothetical protein